MSHGPHRKVALPPNWWALLRERCQAEGFKNVEQFCAARPQLSFKTISNARLTGKMTEASLQSFAEQLGFMSSHELEVAWRITTDASRNFRDIQPRHWQEVPLTERPHPSPGPFSRKQIPFETNLAEFDYVEGWNVRLRAKSHYLLKYDFGKSTGWPEVEIVFFERGPGMLWKRTLSAGAVRTGQRASSITPQSEDWLITCWGKTVVARHAVWWNFVPESYDDCKSEVLELSFAASGGESEADAPNSSIANYFPAIYLTAVD